MPLTPSLSTHPGSFDPLPSNCLQDISINPDNAGRIEQHADNSHHLVISQTAPLGETIRIRALYRSQTISARLTVFDPEQSPLVGYWRQMEGSCSPETVIRELVFSADDTFSVTWEPFETYKDFWGTYRFDEPTGELVLNVRSGNNFRDIRSGTIRLENDQLILDTASFGVRYGGLEECRAPFE